MTNQTYTTVVGTRAELGPLAERITTWRTDRYIEAGFYDPAMIDTLVAAGLAIERNQPSDFEVAVFDQKGRVLATLSLRRPAGSQGRALDTVGRPRYSLESVHGTTFVGSLGHIEMTRCWEVGRFLRDRSFDCSDAVVAVTTAAARLLADLAASGRAEVLIGEAEPTVALRHIAAFGLPTITGSALESPAVDGILADRYTNRTVVPFAVDLRSITDAHRSQWEAMTTKRHLLEEPSSVA